MDTHHFNFVFKFPKIDYFSPEFCMFGRKFSDKKNFFPTDWNLEGGKIVPPPATVARTAYS